MSKCTYLLTQGIFEFQKRGQVKIKGGEEMEMYELLGIRSKYQDEERGNERFREMYDRIEKGELLLGYDV